MIKNSKIPHILLIIIAILDFIIPLGVAIGVLYILVLYFAINESKKTIIIFTVLSVVFVLLKFIVFFNSSIHLYVIVNRIISIVAIIVAAVLIIKRGEVRKELLINLYKLQQKNSELEQLNFISSHHFQEPVKTITAYIDLLKSDNPELENEKNTKYLNYINDAINRINSLSLDIVQFLNIGKQDKKEFVDCNLLINEILNENEIIIKEKKVVIQNSGLPEVNGNKNELKLVFNNLIDNAIKFNKSLNPEIKISASSDGFYWSFLIEDNGIGIESQYINSIFNLFSKLHSKSEYEGTGIGLANCKKIVELHNGRIWVESEYGKGSCFMFNIPKN